MGSGVASLVKLAEAHFDQLDPLLEAEQAIVIFDNACEDVVDCLDLVNVEINGPVPSETLADEKSTHLSRQLVLAVEEIFSKMEVSYERRAEASVKDEMRKSIDRVRFWWLCILHGDIDDIWQEWKLYERTR